MSLDSAQFSGADSRIEKVLACARPISIQDLVRLSMSQRKHRHGGNPASEVECSFIFSRVIRIIELVQLIQMKELWNSASSYLLIIQRP